MFEVCVGIFWPSMGTMRGKYVPEEGRLPWQSILNLETVTVMLRCVGKFHRMKWPQEKLNRAMFNF